MLLGFPFLIQTNPSAPSKAAAWSSALICLPKMREDMISKNMDTRFGRRLFLPNVSMTKFSSIKPNRSEVGATTGKRMNGWGKKFAWAIETSSLELFEKQTKFERFIRTSEEAPTLV
jgi:hypothetical protein